MSGYEELIGRLRAEAANWSATCGDLFDEAATALEAAQQRIKELEDEKQRRIDDEYRRNPFA